MSESHFQQEGSFFEAQVLCFCTLAGIGMVLAGIYLEFVNVISIGNYSLVIRTA